MSAKPLCAKMSFTVPIPLRRNISDEFLIPLKRKINDEFPDFSNDFSNHKHERLLIIREGFPERDNFL